ncbi:MAG: sigma-70 family RNA polymerase sigma factor [Acidobacteria bacterium]|nr:sigma-70 family RNA polymerase sigma factor [Acidobacteriota bacterium]
MLFSKSITLDDEEVTRAAVPADVEARRSADLAFIEKLKEGDEAAFETLVDRYSGDIHALLYRLTENAEEAADLTQDTFLRAVRAIRSFRGESELKTWLFRIAINESRNRHRWWKRRRRNETISLDATIGSSDQRVEDVLSDDSISPEESALMREREQALSLALLELAETYREAVVLCDVEGLTYEETAEALDIGIGTVKSRISRGRHELRRKLKDL